MRCPSCDEANPPTATRCAACGWKLLERPPAKMRRCTSVADEDDLVSTIIPYKNGWALGSYYCGIFALIPAAGLLLGPAAVTLGVVGLRYVNKNPRAKGTAHAIVGLVSGGLGGLYNWILLVFLVMLGFAGRR